MKHKEVEKYKLELKELKSELSDSYQKINCPSCNEAIPSDDLNINDKIAKCGNCNVVFSFSGTIDNLINKPKIKQELIRPEGIDIFYFKDDLDITIQRPLGVGETLASIFLPFFAVMFTMIYVTKPDVPLLLPVILWLLSIGPIISALTSKWHKIHISIDDRNLSITRNPKKFVKDQHFAASNVDQIYVKKMNNLFNVYLVANTVKGQKHIKLITGLDSMSKARYLEQEIEYHLGIEDRKVPEETA